MAPLEGKVAFITGVARGQGRSHAVRLAEDGADIIGVDLCSSVPTVPYALADAKDLEITTKLVADTGRRMIGRVADVRDSDELAAVLAKGVEIFGRVDIVCANAGICSFGELSQTHAAWSDSIDIMLTGTFNTVEVAKQQMIDQSDGGSIVLTSSTAGLRGISPGTPGVHGYGAAKHGIVGLMRDYANELAPHRIRVNTVHPTGCATPMVVNEPFEKYVAETATPDLLARLRNAFPVELIEPQDVSNAIAWLVSDQARYVTGATIPVDAGFLVR